MGVVVACVWPYATQRFPHVSHTHTNWLSVSYSGCVGSLSVVAELAMGVALVKKLVCPTTTSAGGAVPAEPSSMAALSKRSARLLSWSATYNTPFGSTNTPVGLLKPV